MTPNLEYLQVIRLDAKLYNMHSRYSNSFKIRDLVCTHCECKMNYDVVISW